MHGAHGGPPSPPSPPPRKSGNGCLIALAVFGGLILLSGLLAAAFVYRFARSPDGQKIVAAVSSGAALLDEATNAPGVKELQALGCTSALVLDTARVKAIAASLADSGAGELSSAEPLQVICLPQKGATPPGCDAVATTYVRAVGRAAAPFAVSVGSSGGGEPECEAAYSAEGIRR
jgi:hypothetical protein